MMTNRLKYAPEALYFIAYFWSSFLFRECVYLRRCVLFFSSELNPNIDKFYKLSGGLASNVTLKCMTNSLVGLIWIVQWKQAVKQKPLLKLLFGDILRILQIFGNILRILQNYQDYIYQIKRNLMAPRSVRSACDRGN
jgi:hypothetical protein